MGAKVSFENVEPVEFDDAIVECAKLEEVADRSVVICSLTDVVTSTATITNTIMIATSPNVSADRESTLDK